MARGKDPWRDAATYLGTKIAHVFDVGANTGQTSRGLHTAFPSAHIHSFEPVAETYAALVSNTNDIDRIECMNIGFSDVPGTHEIYLQEDCAWNSLEQNVNRGKGSTTIQMETIDNFCADHEIPAIDLLKTDTEGHDLSVLRGASRMLTERRISAVYSEVGFYDEDKQHTNFCTLLAFMQGYGFQLNCFYELDVILYLYHPGEPGFGFTNALFIRNDIVQAKHGQDYDAWLASLGRTAK